jgi:hypothetical protein
MNHLDRISTFQSLLSRGGLLNSPSTMDQSLLNPNPAPQLEVLPQPQTDQYLTLPPELMRIIVELLSYKDLQTFCLASQLYRQLALPVLFRNLVFSQAVAHQVQRFNKARGDVKAAIKFVRCNPSASYLSVTACVL